MTRDTFTHRPVRTAVTTITVPIAAALLLGACGAPTHASLPPVASPSPSSPQAAPAVPPAPGEDAPGEKAPGEKVKVKKVVAVQKSGVVSTKSARSPRPAKRTSAALTYVKIVEPCGVPGRCIEAGTTIEMTACILKDVVDVDYTVDVLQRQRFEYGISAADRKASLRDDAHWLAQRTKTCSAHLSGGTIDQITQAQCLLKASQARVTSLS